MATSRIIEAGRAFVSALDDAGGALASGPELIDALRDYGAIHDRAEAAAVLLVGRMIRAGVFTEHGYTRPEYAIADLLGWDRKPARRRVTLAEQVCPRTTLDGQPLPALLPATATVFTEGAITVAVAEAIVAVLNSPAATRLRPEIWAGVEEQVAHYAATTRATPNDVAGWARQLLEVYDQDGPEPRPEPEQANEFHMTRKPRGTGFWVRGELNNLVGEVVRTAIDALCATRTRHPRGADPRGAGAEGDVAEADVAEADSDGAGEPHPLGWRANNHAPGPHPYVDQRTLPQRQADALGELCGFALHHDPTLPDTGGERPQIRLTLNLERLRAGISGAHLDTGAWYPPSQLRMLACDCSLIPAILGTNSEVLDIGRATRTIPAGIRRAVAIRDRGCSFPGCDRPPSWCDVHHCTEWCDGGDTALHNCTMLCKTHHLIIHGTKWTVRIRDGQPEFIPPPFLDPLQRIRQKPRVAAR